MPDLTSLCFSNNQETAEILFRIHLEIIFILRGSCSVIGFNLEVFVIFFWTRTGFKSWFESGLFDILGGLCMTYLSYWYIFSFESDDKEDVHLPNHRLAVVCSMDPWQLPIESGENTCLEKGLIFCFFSFVNKNLTVLLTFGNSDEVMPLLMSYQI